MTLNPCKCMYFFPTYLMYKCKKSLLSTIFLQFFFWIPITSVQSFRDWNVDRQHYMFNNRFVPQYLGNSSLPSPQSVFPSHWDPGGAQVPSSHVCWPWGQSRVVVPTFRNSVIQYNFAKKLIFQPKIKFSRSLIHNVYSLGIKMLYMYF